MKKSHKICACVLMASITMVGCQSTGDNTQKGAAIGAVLGALAGHTDSTGDADYNQQLSMMRTNSVAAYLVSSNLYQARLQTIAFGETQPVASNDTEDGRHQNRRVELPIIPLT